MNLAWAVRISKKRVPGARRNYGETCEWSLANMRDAAAVAVTVPGLVVRGQPRATFEPASARPSPPTPR